MHISSFVKTSVYKVGLTKDEHWIAMMPCEKIFTQKLLQFYIVFDLLLLSARDNCLAFESDYHIHKGKKRVLGVFLRLSQDPNPSHVTRINLIIINHGGNTISCIPDKVFRDFHPFWIFPSYTRGCKMTSCMMSESHR